MRRFPTTAVILAAALVLLSPLTGSAAPAESTANPGHVRHHPRSDPHSWQTSDRVVGPSRPTLPSYARASRSTRVRFHYQARPGVMVSSYQQRIGTRNLRYFVLRASWKTPGVGFNLIQPPHVGSTDTVWHMTHATPHAIAGVNGDFFDIGETGAPLGLGVRRGQVEHGINWGWNQAFYINRKGNPQIGTEPMKVRAPRYPLLGITNLNSPQVRPGGIGLYDARWGRTSGYAWTQWQKKNVAAAHIVNHKVVDMRKMYAAGKPLVGKYLIARDAKAVKRLHKLKVGANVWFRASAANNPRTALTGNALLLRKGKVVATDNRELHPRTAVGIDPYHHWVFLIVVEGRQEFSDGFTMVELARKLRALGCKSALNLDGGGSSTFVATRKGALRVLNSPSDGTQRHVGNGLAVTYARPSKRAKRHRHRHHR